MPSQESPQVKVNQNVASEETKRTLKKEESSQKIGKGRRGKERRERKI
jgi:hypothetical protein